MSFFSKRIFQGDFVIWGIYFLLCMISLVEVFSAASALSYSSGDFMAPFFKQLFFILLGAVVAWVVHRIPCRFFRILPILAVPGSILLLLLALCFGSDVNNSSRWFLGFQPSEVAKPSLIIWVALFLSSLRKGDNADRRAFWIIFWPTLIIVGLIMPENLSTAMLLAATVYIMMLIGRVPADLMCKLTGGIVGIGLIGLASLFIVPDSAFEKYKVFHRVSTWKSRLTTQSEGTGEFYTDSGALNVPVLQEYLNENSQKAHAAIAIASSHGVGKMPGRSKQRDYLAQAYSDFIFAIIIEEMGLWGAGLVIALYVILLFRAGRIASRCERGFPAFLTMGLTLLLVLQAMINILVAVGIFPVTGQPLPLISRGGTSTLITSAYFGAILSVSNYARRNLNGKDPALLTAGEKDAAAADDKANREME
jgi:cell division protein FtsW